MNWYVLHTKPRHEKKVEKDLLALGINAYCPTRPEYRVWSDRKKKIEKPVLSSMVLVRVDEKELNNVFYSKSVLRYMFWLGKRAIVRDFEVEILKQSLLKNNIPDPKVGSIIGISSFGNKLGTIDKLSKNKIWVSLQDLGYRLMLETA
ncbi:MAG: hypothetical protein CMF42_03710 [Legionellales bacterium]|nr:hypothetical protein [Legionellales bacterium]